MTLVMSSFRWWSFRMLELGEALFTAEICIKSTSYRHVSLVG